MNQDLALSVLSDIMSWDSERARREFAWLQLMSKFKYDGYADYVAGVRFIESLAGWLQQFAANERAPAYDFVKVHIAYFSTGQIQHLVELAYPERVRPRLLREVARSLDKPSYLVWSDPMATDLYRKLLRKSLFFGLSDGSRIDAFRRSTAGVVSNEQVLLATEIAPEKWNQILDDLRKDLKDDDARFRFLFLFDDFTGTGTTLLGKLSRLWRVCSEHKIVNSHFDTNWTVVVHHYIATESVSKTLPKKELELRQKNKRDWFHEVEFSFELVIPESLKINQSNVNGFWPLIQKYYNDGIETTHTRKGGSDVRLGFGQCALPIVLEHNTPNNSIALIWADIDEKGGQPAMRPLFRRRQRHNDLT